MGKMCWLNGLINQIQRHRAYASQRQLGYVCKEAIKAFNSCWYVTCSNLVPRQSAAATNNDTCLNDTVNAGRLYLPKDLKWPSPWHGKRTSYTDSSVYGIRNGQLWRLAVMRFFPVQDGAGRMFCSDFCTSISVHMVSLLLKYYI